MTAALSRALHETYERAVYEADLATGHVVFHIGGAPEGTAPGGTLAIVTAWNPAHERPGLHVNERANARLSAEMERLGFAYSPALGRSEDGAHVEPSFAVPGIAREEAIALGRRFRQAAVFYWDGAKAHILSCSAGTSATIR